MCCVPQRISTKKLIAYKCKKNYADFICKFRFSTIFVLPSAAITYIYALLRPVLCRLRACMLGKKNVVSTKTNAYEWNRQTHPKCPYRARGVAAGVQQETIILPPFPRCKTLPKSAATQIPFLRQYAGEPGHTPKRVRQDKNIHSATVRRYPADSGQRGYNHGFMEELIFYLAIAGFLVSWANDIFQWKRKQ